MSVMKKTRIATSVTLVLTASQVLAAAPDAGQTLQQLQQKPFDIPKTDELSIIVPALGSHVEPGGPKVKLNKIRITGNNSITTEELEQAVLSVHLDQMHDFAGIRAIADEISQYYRNAGYPFARAYIPQQSLGNGELAITLLEGQYGNVITTGDIPLFSNQAGAFLLKLKKGDAIRSESLERATLLLSDQPGIQTSATMQPSTTIGAGDLIVDIKRVNPVNASLGIDNFGNRYTGENRLLASVNLNNPYKLGHQINLNAIYTNQSMWFGGIGYQMPVTGDGLKANFSYSRTAYELGKEFSNLGAQGTADVLSVGLSYALIRSQKTNVGIGVSVQHKDLNDRLQVGTDTNNKSSNSLPLTINFDHRDTLFGGGISFGTIAWTQGTLSLNDALKKADTNNTNGDFGKLTLDLVRLQYLTDKASLYVRASGQWSTKNLDSSEDFGIGGINAVRAYPVGEGYGDIGWFSQLELRYAINKDFMPYAFYDFGSSTLNKTTTIGGNKTTDISGAGIGLRYFKQNWKAELTAAWRLSNNRPSDLNAADSTPILWGSVTYLY
ncbi:MAG: ShlB/FhaC/HecB family hemolysin secretion/activation protein [Thiotrichales bacterium]|nr:ShlB/FhaC/HecB family hemolysin secretion/activation protein [Thiotrichales bacterium]